MADTVCVSTPTLTSTAVSNSLLLSTTIESSVFTVPGSTITSVYTTCAISPNTTSCLTSTTVIAQPGVVSTQIVTLTNTIDVPITALATFYGLSCRTIGGQTTPTTPTLPLTRITRTTTPTSTSTITTTSYSTYTGTSLMTSDGTTFTSYYTSVSTTVPPVSSSSDGTTTSTTSTLSGLITDPLQTGTPAPANNNTAAIVGGTLGGLAALGLLALLTWRMIQKSHRFDNLFNKDRDTNQYGLPPKTVPLNPYQYGLVAQQDTQPVGFSPPGSPGLQHANLVNEMGAISNPVGSDPGAHTGSSAPFGTGSSGNEMGVHGLNTANQGPISHTTANQGPISHNTANQGSVSYNTANQGSVSYNTANQGPISHNTANQGSVSYNTANQAPVHHSRNPSAAPLLVGITGGGHTRPNTGSSRASVASESLGPMVMHASSAQNMGYPPQPFNSYPPALAAYAQHQSNVPAQVQSQQQNLSHNTSIGSSAAFSAADSSSSSNPSNFVPMGAGGVLRRPTSISQHSQLMHYDDPFARSGSPVGYQDRQILHVMNAEPSNVYDEGPSSRTFGTPGLSMSGQFGPTVDGMGRPVGGEKAPLVYLDGGAYEDQPRTPAPPAYRE